MLCAAPAQAQRRCASRRPRIASPTPVAASGLKSVYGLDVAPVFVPLTVADAGISALDDGDAEVAVAFSSIRRSRGPDIVTLRDDRRMIYPDRVVPVVRSELLRAYGREGAADIRRRLNAASSALHHAGAAQPQPVGRSTAGCPRPSAASSSTPTGSAAARQAPHRAADRRRLPGLRRERDARVPLRRGAAGGRLPRPGQGRGGLRAEALKALRTGTISLYPGYDGSLLAFISREAAGHEGDPRQGAPARPQEAWCPGREVRARAGPQRLRDEDRHRRGARSVHLSDAAKYWPAAPSRRAAPAARASSLNRSGASDGARGRRRRTTTPRRSGRWRGRARPSRAARPCPPARA